MIFRRDEGEMIKGKNYGITAANLLGHEIIGLSVKVIKSTDKGRVGMEGVIVNETQNTFVLLGNCGEKEKEFVIPKKECEFEFDLGNDEKVIVKGNDVLKKPEERVKEFRN
ncbi:MAG: ribonuclease P protein subunit [archaeon]